MKSLRKIGFLLWLALALALGQQAGLLHGLAHAAEKVSQKRQDPKPATQACEQCSLCAQLTGLARAPLAPIERLEGRVQAAPFVEQCAIASTTVVFRSRAPPVLH